MTNFTVSGSEGFEGVIVPEAVYKAKITDVRTDTTQYGNTMFLTFEITEGKHQGKDVDGIANIDDGEGNIKITPKKKIGKWLTNMGLDIEEGFSFEENDLIGTDCRILTTNTNTDGEDLDASRVEKVVGGG